MSSHSVKVMVPPVVEAPRGAQWAAAVGVWVGRAFGAGSGSPRVVVGKPTAPSVKRLGAKGAV
jgi:hypothetical protein